MNFNLFAINSPFTLISLPLSSPSSPTPCVAAGGGGGGGVENTHTGRQPAQRNQKMQQCLSSCANANKSMPKNCKCNHDAAARARLLLQPALYLSRHTGGGVFVLLFPAKKTPHVPVAQVERMTLEHHSLAPNPQPQTANRKPQTANRKPQTANHSHSNPDGHKRVRVAAAGVRERQRVTCDV